MRPLDAEFADLLASSKADFVLDARGAPGAACQLSQTGATTVAWRGERPRWPSGLAADEPTIETFVGSPDGVVTPMSDHQPFVDAWREIAVELNASVRAALTLHGLELEGDAYITASLTPVAELEGAPHVDDPTFEPHAGAGIVAIVGQHAGTRVANEPVEHDAVRAFGQVEFSDEVLARFTRGEIGHDVGSANEIVVFPQFAQLHAGPAANDIAAELRFRQLFVLRARAVKRRPPMPR